jgi:hypothetical protein
MARREGIVRRRHRALIADLERIDSLTWEDAPEARPGRFLLALGFLALAIAFFGYRSSQFYQ